MIDQYAVIGNPISHSKSPLIHTLFAEQTGQVLEYSALLGEVGQLKKAVENFRQNNGKGMNVTVPFKQDAWALVNERNIHAEKAGAVNTIIIRNDGYLIGDNTDGIGLVSDLSNNLKFEFKNKNILMLGAGGAVRGVLGPILAKQPQKIVIVNRTESKADELAKLFSDEGNIQSESFENLMGQKFDLIINGTAASLSGDIPPIPESVVQDAFCYDMMYGAEDTAFMSWAKQHGAKATWDGLGMLVEQAAESFYLWRNVRPDTRAVIDHVRSLIRV